MNTSKFRRYQSSCGHILKIYTNQYWLIDDSTCSKLMEECVVSTPLTSSTERPTNNSFFFLQFFLPHLNSPSKINQDDVFVYTMTSQFDSFAISMSRNRFSRVYLLRHSLSSQWCNYYECVLWQGATCPVYLLMLIFLFDFERGTGYNVLWISGL